MRAPAPIEARLGPEDAAAVAARVDWTGEHDVARRLWRGDHTLWQPDPTEVADRLGWLGVAESMRGRAGELTAFAEEVRADGLTHALLLGMGGSSLAPEVLGRTFGPAPGGLALTVLDSTHPDAVLEAERALPLERTLVVVSTKSGGTLETASLLRRLAAAVGDPSRFVAITDPGSALAEQAEREGFRRTFLGVPEIGGRFSALSVFGLVPAALTGIDVAALLDRAIAAAAAERGEGTGPALWLGAALGELARRGRDKLTLVADPPLGAFGLWAEQLVAESTGKGGRGIVPVAGEPVGEPAGYDRDRVFVHLRGRRGGEDEARLAGLAAAGHPVITLPVAGPEDLGAQFFSWELAVAVAGAVLGLNPFDQPNVQEAKDLTAETIEAHRRRGGLSPERPGAVRGAVSVLGSGCEEVEAALAALLARVRAGRSYVAVLAFAPPSAEADAELERLRLVLRDGWRATTTVGYGPRYLHSTGQLHKGGPPTGVFLLLTTDGSAGVEVPGAGYDFAALVRAQAIGDGRALAGRGLPLLRIHLAGPVPAALAELTAAVAAAVDRDGGVTPPPA